MELVRIDEDNFDLLRPLMLEFYEAVGQSKKASGGISLMRERVERLDQFSYVVRIQKKPVAYLSAYLSHDEEGEHLFVHQLYTRIPMIGNRLASLAERIAMLLGVGKIKSVCWNERIVTTMGRRRGYSRAGIVIEKSLGTGVQISNKRDVEELNDGR